MENLEETSVELVKDLENTEKGKSNSDKIWTIWKKGKLNSEKIWKIRKQSRLNSEKIWKLWRKVS